MYKKLSISLLATILLVSCTGELTVNDGDVKASASKKSKETAKEFVDRVNKEAAEMQIAGAKTAWISQTYITDDTEYLEAKSNEKYLKIASENIEATKGLSLDGADEKTKRAVNLIKIGSSLPSPNDAEKRAELAKIVSSLGATYGKGKYCPNGDASCKRRLAYRFTSDER